MKRVIVLSRQSLFGNGIASMLSQETDIEMVTWDTQLCDVVQCIRDNNPDAIIFNCDDPTQDIALAILFALKEKFEMMIIGISLSNNWVTVYRGEQKQIIQKEDLLKVIHNF